jgi:F0F1-type ATP synthase membrane subunit c/vacuolar-type H+-ATPase subunit K
MQGKRPEEGGKAILMATMIEVFALLALLVSLLGILFV